MCLPHVCVLQQLKKNRQAKQKSTLKAQSEKNLSPLLTDFEKRGELLNLPYTGLVYPYTDENEQPKGTSIINELKRNDDKTVTLKPLIEKGKGAYNSDGFLQMSGKVTTAFPYGFIGCGLSFWSDKHPTDISQFKGIKFWASGSGTNFVIRLENSLVKDFSYHGCEFFPSDQWEEYVIPFENFNQPSWKTTTVNLKDVLKSVTSIQWQTNSRPLKKYFLCLDNIEFIK